MKSFKRQLGFTLVEVIAVIGFMAILATAGIPMLKQYSDDKVARGATDMMRQIQIAARDHRSTTGAWPNSIADLIGANEIPAGAAVSPFGTPWVFNVVGADLFQITVDTTEQRFGKRMQGSDLPFATLVGNVFSSTITRSGLEQAHNALYSRDGSKPLTGDMDAANHNINNVANLGASTVNTTTVNSSNINNSGTITTDVLNANTINVPGDINTTGPISSGGDVIAPRFIDSNNPAYIVDPNGTSTINNVTINGLTQLNGDLELTVTNTSGAGCTGHKISVDSTGKLLTCVSGIWKGGSGGGATDYIAFPDSSFTNGGLTIKSGNVWVNSGGGGSYYSFAQPFASGSAVNCTAVIDYYSYGSQAVGCSADQFGIILKQGNASGHYVNFTAIGMSPP